MLKKLGFFLLMPFLLLAEWNSLDKHSDTNVPPQVTLLEESITGSVIRFEISGFEINNLQVEGKSYRQVDLLGESFTGEAGKAGLPYLSKISLADPSSLPLSTAASRP